MKTIIFILPFLAICLQGADWPRQFGADSSNVSEADKELNASWGDAGPVIKWKVNIGNGFSTPTIADGRVYVLGNVKPGADVSDGVSEDEAWTQNEFMAGDPDFLNKYGEIMGQRLLLPGTLNIAIDEYVWCLDQASGQVVWQTKVVDLGFTRGEYIGSRAAPTVAGELLIVHTYDGQVHAIKRDSGEVVWKVNLREHGMLPDSWVTKAGNGAAPLLYKDFVIIAYTSGSTGQEWYAKKNPDGSIAITNAKFKEAIDKYHGGVVTPELYEALKAKQHYLLALDVATGERKWRAGTLTGFRSNWTSPTLGEIEGKPTVVLSTGVSTFAVNPEDGTERWTYKYEEDFLMLYDPKYPRVITREWVEANVPELLPQWARYVAENGGKDEPLKWELGPQILYNEMRPAISGNHVLCTFNFDYNSWPSCTFMLKVEKDQPRVIWTTNQMVSFRTAIHVITDGVVYGNDYYVQRGKETQQMAMLIRPWREESPENGMKYFGQFQCRDEATGKLIWSSDAFKRAAPNETAWFPTTDAPHPRRQARDEGYLYSPTPALFTISKPYVFVVQPFGLFSAEISREGLKNVSRFVPNPRMDVVGYAVHPVIVGTDMFIRKGFAMKSDQMTTLGGNDASLICYDLKK